MWSKERVRYDGHKEKKLLKNGVRSMGNSGAKGGFAHWCSERSRSLRLLPSLSLHENGTFKRLAFLLLSCIIIIFSSWLTSITSYRRQGPKFPDLIIKNLCANTHNVMKKNFKARSESWTVLRSTVQRSGHEVLHAKEKLCLSLAFQFRFHLIDKCS